MTDGMSAVAWLAGVVTAAILLARPHKPDWTRKTSRGQTGSTMSYRRPHLGF